MDVSFATVRTHAHRARKQDRCHQRACKRSSHMHMGDTLRRVPNSTVMATRETT